MAGAGCTNHRGRCSELVLARTSCDGVHTVQQGSRQAPLQGLHVYEAQGVREGSAVAVCGAAAELQGKHYHRLLRRRPGDDHPPQPPPGPKRRQGSQGEGKGTNQLLVLLALQGR